ncbi:recombinase RecT [Mycobacterium yunnanensis]|uniref:Recombinase RecT n=1 Tax=Mycobacterium yunnanensis TaxID=368477 RepID=A0A9X2Z8Y0_9MYCO|nr:recombinase RecT [Mycobacterium yunnanensis]MCV7424381.1 recombinase RecT [Mycobacterium yunnanensis]
MTAAVAKTNDKPTLAQLIEQMKPEIGRALPKHMNPERMARIATTVLRQTPALARCTPESFLGALMTSSQLGLEPGPTGEAYLVPYGTVCTFIPGYRGLIKLARNSGQLVDIWAEVVYENDTFKYTLGLRRDLQHEPAAGERGKPIYVYAAAQLKDGGTPFVVMTYTEVEAIRARSKAGRNGPWVTDWNAMAKKTLVKQLAKWLPLSAEFTSATVLDGTVRTDVGPLVDVQPDYIDGEMGDAPAVEAGPPPSADVVLAGKTELAQLKQIRDAERYGDDESWFAYVQAATGATVTADKDLTLEQAQKLIELFNEDAAK